MQSELGSRYQYGDTFTVFGNSRPGTSKDYFYETFGSLSFTFEGARRNENRNFLKHIRMWEKIFAYLNAATLTE